MNKIKCIGIMLLCMTMSLATSAQKRQEQKLPGKTNRTIVTQNVSQSVTTSTYKNWYVGGSIGLSSSSYDGSTTSSSFSFSPEVGYQLNEDWSIGVSLTYSDRTNKNGQVDLSYTNFSINPYARYTFLKEGNFSIFCDGGFSYGTSNNQTLRQEGGNYEAIDNKTNNFSINITPGIAYNISNSFSLVAHVGRLGYTSSKPDASGAKATTTFNLSLSNSISFGAFYHF